MTQIYNMKGILRGVILDSSAGLPEGVSIERVKDGAPTGDVKFYPFADLGEHAAEIKEAASKLQKDQQIDYQTSNYKPVKIGPAGSLTHARGGWSGGRVTPEDRRSIERQKALDITARVFESLIGKSESKTTKSFSEIMAEILVEAEKTAAWIHQEGKQ
jgi:hypothetical protein